MPTELRRRADVRHVVACLIALVSSAASLPADPGALQLPEVVITETTSRGRHENWRYTRLGPFEVLSGVPDRHARVTLRELDRYARTLALIWPAAGGDRPRLPTTVILCGPTTGYFAYLRPDGSQHGESSLLLTGPDRAALVINQEDLPASDTAATGEDETVGQLHANFERRGIQLYLRLLLASQQARLPLWLEAGLLQTLADIEVHHGWLTYGKVNTEQNNSSGEQTAFTIPDDWCAPSQVADLSFKQVFAHRKFMPFEQFFTARRTNGADPSLDSVWAKQAYTFVHFCLFGEDLRHKESLIRFAGRLADQAPTEELFRECFGLGYRAMEKEMRAYLLHTRHKYQRYALTTEQRPVGDTFSFAPATAAQIGRLKGDASALAGRFDIALETYANAYRQGVRDPQIVAGYALTLLAAPTGDRVLARKLINAAVQAGVDRPTALVAQARLRLEEFAADPGPDGKLTPNQLSLVLAPLFKARQQSPSLAATYATIAEAWRTCSVQPKPEQLAVLDEGIRRFPRDTNLLLQAAELHRQAGSTPAASAIAHLGRRTAASPEDRSRFERLIQSLPAPLN